MNIFSIIHCSYQSVNDSLLHDVDATKILCFLWSEFQSSYHCFKWLHALSALAEEEREQEQGVHGNKEVEEYDEINSKYCPFVLLEYPNL